VVFNKRKQKQKTKAVKHTTNPILSEKEHNMALTQSIVVIGPEDVGKSVLSKNFARKYGLLYVNMHEALYCHTDPLFIKKEIHEFSYLYKQARLISDVSKERRYGSYKEIEESKLRYRLWFPDVPNLHTLDPEHRTKFLLLKKLDTFDDVCEHMFYKNYEEEIIKKIINTVTTPCVVDMTTQGPIYLTQEYKKRVPILLADYEQGQNDKYSELTSYLKEHNLEISDLVKLPKETFSSMSHKLQQFGNIVALEYPAHKTPNLNHINQMFVDSGQYTKLAQNKTITADFVEFNPQHGSQIIKQKLTECMDIMASLVYDHNPNIYNDKKEIEITF